MWLVRSPCIAGAWGKLHHFPPSPPPVSSVVSQYVRQSKDDHQIQFRKQLRQNGIFNIKGLFFHVSILVRSNYFLLKPLIQ